MDVSFQQPASYLAALLMGTTYGVAYCGPSCGPFLCTYIMGAEPGGMRALKSMVIFNAARILTYALIGALSALLGTAVIHFSSIAWWSSVLLGLVVIGIGVMMWLHPIRQAGLDAPITIGESARTCSTIRSRLARTSPLWLVGVAFALTPCPPMLAMVACSAQAGSPSMGATIMVLFGVGTAISPLIIMAVLAGSFSQRFRHLAPEHTRLFRRTASAVLIVLGCSMILGGI